MRSDVNQGIKIKTECFKATVEIFFVRLLSKRCSRPIKSSQELLHVPVISQCVAAREPEINMF